METKIEYKKYAGDGGKAVSPFVCSKYGKVRISV